MYETSVFSPLADSLRTVRPLAQQLADNDYNGTQSYHVLLVPKAKFHRAVNSVLKEMLSFAAEDLILHLIKVKCMFILLQCVEGRDLN